MSYLREYKIVPKESFTVIRNCSGCGAKTNYKNTMKFRVNANGNKLDAWLIYQCENCKHTYNLSIYRGQKANTIPKDEFQRFWDNDELLASEYGKNYEFFKQNKAEVRSSEIEYELVKFTIDKNRVFSEPSGAMRTAKGDAGAVNCHNYDQASIIIHNPYGLKIRPEKQIASVLNLSRGQVAKMMESEEIQIESSLMKCLVIKYYAPLKDAVSFRETFSL